MIEGRRPPLSRRTLAVEVAEVLRDMILGGDLTPDRHMTQDELARMLGVSTMPVREALLRLAAEGFVEVSPNRAFKVAPISRGDVHDVYWMHATLAGELTRRACRVATPELLRQLGDLEGAYTAAVEAGDADAAERTNWELHRTINVAADAPKLLLILRATLRFIPRGFYGLVPGWGPLGQRGHDEILRAFDAGDADAAGEAASAHVRDAGDLLAQFFTTRGYWARPGSGEPEGD
ncbi:MAG: GntR family transcriptional regulator [Solirubrobacterales bacterium]|nr:GntR family transcriptional regulator [Solirubrobacterales bacterium]